MNCYTFLPLRYVCLTVALCLFLPGSVSASGTGSKTDSMVLEKLLNTDLILKTDSLTLEQLPLKEAYKTIYKGDRVVVAEITHEKGKTCFKIARDQETQGWIEFSQIHSLAPAPLFSQLT